MWDVEKVMMNPDMCTVAWLIETQDPVGNQIECYFGR